ncbi:EamA family transporter RarD [Deefgea salmonis]|uniref:EamA family transporter RarD n=1 Tax=Deefgea salmonis TaxID=2875502 RepID=A0ABS8BLS9_9NEIS|nr:EamA family transporter RarD [Deefgea salmonis]MCB5196659.1 EamA family transporter RarD [Deefgea salmonis]
MQIGIIYTLLAFLIWGLFPLYFKALHGIAPEEIVLHRFIWSLVFLSTVLLIKQRWAWLKPALKQPKLIGVFVLSAVLLASNWYTYIWAVNAGRVVDASLGYFINPLISVVLGVIFLHERLRRAQWLAMAIAAAGVAWLTWQAGHLPWVALILACTFALYGLLRKTAQLGALEGLSLETLVLFPIALVAMVYLLTTGQSDFVRAPISTQALVLLAGPITAIPLLLFAAGARRIPLSLVGILQYTGPTLQLLIGVFVFHETFGAARIIGFGLIWLALAVYAMDGWLNYRRNSK